MDNLNEKNSNEMEISLSQMLSVLKKSVVFMVVAAVIVAAMAAAYAVFLDKPSYIFCNYNIFSDVHRQLKSGGLDFC